MISVLLVEPHEDSRDLYAAVLQSLGFRVSTAATTDAARDLLAQADVLVTALQVPGQFDGIALIEWVRSHADTHAMPIVVLTACVDPSHEKAARAAGCDVFLGKPCLPVDLATEIRHVVMRRATRTATMVKARSDRRTQRVRSGKAR